MAVATATALLEPLFLLKSSGALGAAL